MHEHVFKVGWLITKKQRTTTLLYYTFFLPGVILHELVRWLVAGLLNVRADRAIKLPDEQQIAELKLNFVRVHRSAGEFRSAIISAAPFLVGLVLVYAVNQSVLRVPEALVILSSGTSDNLSGALSILLSAPDVWLWIYLVFTVANTMMPSWASLRGWRIVGIVVAIGIGILALLGVADEIFNNTIAAPLMTVANVLSFTFAFVIGVDLIVTAALGTIEAVIERITGDSATFQNGKLIAVTRKERIRQQEQERLRRERQQKAASKRSVSGPPSIYNLPFPIPDAPEKGASQTVTVRRDEQSTLTQGAAPPGGSPRQPPSVISGAAPEKPGMAVSVSKASRDTEDRSKPIQRDSVTQQNTPDHSKGRGAGSAISSEVAKDEGTGAVGAATAPEEEAAPE
ncbi:MAG: hypothetical protein L6Q98_08095 [Anaerolineae bacterium]|nr:hypothetical protein [Anaerolineae bacterium]NUQ02551.1 hypothetical protein [Anaerolineae bacterium]